MVLKHKRESVIGGYADTYLTQTVDGYSVHSITRFPSGNFYKDSPESFSTLEAAERRFQVAA